ncbi:MAG: HAD-IIIA family hydrolase [Bacteroidetes bacterium]|nr:HAD-IIIA family hydrolase [Bacteroidota bacterium]MBK8362740.1 HAD-IIIA family hydrolase [Bacteroidota bacterium]MBL0032137.1 HAD-IIIA family hydrolase [Bacteroidota bacterium]MBP6426661.1 HAD-IIIA family hydrolase [Bacteroidia bacterium]MBP6656399.1 HAD-IIIA family hydrolase [Bacteroidia bacterium]
MKNFKETLHPIRCFVFDVDGVLTDNRVVVMPNELHRIMNIRDGFALKEAVDTGYHVIIISGGKSESVRTRLANLGIKDIYLGVKDKTVQLDEVKKMYGLKTDEILYMGDDIPDYYVMQQVGVPTCPNDAVHEIRELCTYVSPFNGGEGCVRDVIEQTLKLHGKWPVK